MPTLTEVRTGFKTVLEANLPGFGVYEVVAANIQPPCAVVVPTTSDFQMAFNRAVDEWYFDLHILVPSADDAVGQKLLDQYVTGYGDLSVVNVLASNPNLDLGRTCSLAPMGMTAYNFRFQAVGADHIGATLRIKAILSNRG